MSELNECPICMDIIGDKNCLTTECGHKFHTNCMFSNIDHNGFICPCCRAQMIAENNDSDDDTDTDTDTDTGTDYESVDETISDEPGSFSEDSLRGLRLLTNLLEGHEHDQADVLAEYNYVNEAVLIVPPREIIQQKLIEKGVTYEQLVAWILIDHLEYTNQEDELETISGNLFEKIKEIIVEYRPEEESRIIEDIITDFVRPIHIENEEVDHIDALLSLGKVKYERKNFMFESVWLESTMMDNVDYTAQPKN